jgi:polyisoprenoid-binding protein YceI
LYAQEAVLELVPADTQIDFTVPGPLNSVHGTFKLKSGTISFDLATGKASGQVVVDVPSGETGNNSRDRKMHKDVLESRKYPEAIFTPVSVIGRVDAQGDSPIDLTGTLQLHGGEHELTLATTVSRAGDRLTASTHFEIPYADWGMKNPSSLLLHVGSQVELDVKIVARIRMSPPAHPEK